MTESVTSANGQEPSLNAEVQFSGYRTLKNAPCSYPPRAVQIPNICPKVSTPSINIPTVSASAPVAVVTGAYPEGTTRPR